MYYWGKTKFTCSTRVAELYRLAYSERETVKQWYNHEVFYDMEHDQELLVIETQTVETKTIVWRYYADTMTVKSHIEPIGRTRPELAVRAQALHLFGTGWYQASDWVGTYCQRFPEVIDGLKQLFRERDHLEAWCAEHTKRGKINVSKLPQDSPLFDIDPLMVTALLLQYKRDHDVKFEKFPR